MASAPDDFDAAPPEEWSEDWADTGEEETPVVRCTHCGAEVYREADCCPACGEFLTADYSFLRTKPSWFVSLGLLGVAVVILVLSGILNWL